MKVIVVEDEQLARERLIELIGTIKPEFEILNAFDSIEDTVAYLRQEPQFDLMFLDIHLSDGPCFDIFDQVNVFKPIIFTTAYDQYSIEAFKHHSIDYLLKPIHRSELEHALTKLDKINAMYGQGEKMDAETPWKKLISGLTKKYKSRFLVKSGNTLQYCNADDIGYIFAEDKYVYLVLNNSRTKFLIDHKLEELEKSLLNPHQFFRINRKYIVHINAIHKVVRKTPTRLELMLHYHHDTPLPVSRDKTQALKEWLNQ